MLLWSFKKNADFNSEYYHLFHKWKFCYRINERKSEQAHIPHTPTLLENAVYNEWQFQALGIGNRTKKGI